MHQTFTRTASVCFALAAIVLTAPAAGEEPAPAARPDPGRSLAAAVDAEGELRRPTAEEAAALAEQLRARYRGAEGDDGPAVYRPDGSVSRTLGTRRMSFTMARVEADGSLTTACVEGVERAAAFVADSAAGRADETGSGAQR